MATRPLAPARGAGAVAHRHTKKGTRILLVHRPRYGDWTLPKGHLEGGETYQEAALRELVEEAGVQGELGRLVGSIAYRVKRKPKVIRYWLVEAGSIRFRTNAEVDEVLWTSPSKAMLRASHDNDRVVIAAAMDRLQRPRSARMHLVRHADAGSRSAWKRADEKRPLSTLGRTQARRIAARLQQTPITHIASSPFLRCEQTVVGLARALDLPIDIEKALAEEQPIERILDLFAELEGTTTVLSSHGDVISGLIGKLAAEGVDLDGGLVWKKASTWDLELTKGRVRTGGYVPPPR
ncbi:MAG: NUDIX hydrolase [Acidimicrobiia bacterium]|nr:NUDIX hydrolase [Acidimicrobiia bacterium]